ncbi:MAG: hypothetical protein J3R72DRAFT_440930 [Linnemannia gamsii]|nr:MAG: hypothetical protein J3R72DRAFT_440930 [Linnemannia gamsii]
MTYDPSHYKNNVEKLLNLQAGPLPLDQLVYEIDENEPVPKGKHLSSEVALAPFLAKSKLAPTAAPTATIKSPADRRERVTAGSTAVASEPSRPSSSDKIDTSNDRAMMASVLAGLDMSPRAMSLDGSDFEDNGDDGGYMDDFGGMGDTNTDDLFGDVAMDDEPFETVPKAERDSRSEDLFGDDDDEEDEKNRPSLDFLEDEDEDESEGEYQEDGDEGMESDGEEQDDEEDEEEDEEDDEGLDEETIKAIAQLQKGSSSSGGGGLFDSDDDQDTKSGDDEEESDATKFAEDSNAARLKAQETREAELAATREKQQQLIASTLANIDSQDKKAGHVVFDDSDDYDSEDFEQIEADHNKKMAKLNKPPKSIFDSDSGSDSEAEEDSLTPKKKRKGVKEMFASDDEEEEDSGLGGKFGEPDLGIKEQFEGPGGKALFKMQTKIGTGDSRFQLTKDFLDERIREDDDVDYMAHKERLEGEEYAEGGAGSADIILDEERQVESNVTAEKLQALNVLRSMFGDSAVRSKKKDEDLARKAKGGVGYTTGLTARYDPDAEPAPAPAIVESSPEPDESHLTVFTDSESEAEPVKETPPKVEGKPSKKAADFSFASDEDDLKGDKEPSTSALAKKKSVGFSFGFDEDDLKEDKESSTSSAPVKKDTDISTKFQVASDLKSLFAPAEGSFKMFGGGDDDDDEDEGEDDTLGDVEDDRMDGSSARDDREDDTIMTAYTDGARTIFTSGAEALNRTHFSHSGSLFFYHFKNPSLLKRSNFKTNNKVFMRTNTMDEVTANWEKTRHTMTQEFKRKHKSSTRNKARASKRFKTNASGPSDHP